MRMDRPPERHRIRGSVCRVAWVLFAWVATAAAQEPSTPVELQETDLYGMGARALGMGRSYVAVAEDASALYYNPAGLAQVRQVELSGGFHYSDVGRDASRSRSNSTDASTSRLEHLVLAYPVPTYRGGLVFAFGFHQVADLEVSHFKEGFLVPASESNPGLFEVDSYRRQGSLKAFTAGAAIDLSAHLSAGGSLSYLYGRSQENITLQNGVPSGSGLDFGSPDNPDERLFSEVSYRDADASGWTGSVGFMAYTDNGFRIGGAIDFQKSIDYDGYADNVLEDYEKIDGFQIAFLDEMTLPLSLKGGVSWGRKGLLLSGGLRWTDYQNIDFEGEILAPPEGQTFQPQPAYRSVVAFDAGAEYQLPSAPVRFRAGFFNEPLPYRLVSADTDFTFVPDDENAGTFDDVSVVRRDYPVGDIRSDAWFWTLGAGVLIEEALAVDVAFVRGSWERATPAGYENTTAFYATMPTVEKVSQNQLYLTTAVHFD